MAKTQEGSAMPEDSIAAMPIGEEIARGGPFVMNTKDEIVQAIKDYQNGTFAKY